jgi:hypothetical protein
MGFRVKKERRWTNGKIPYQFAEKEGVVPESSRELVKKVMKYWEKNIGGGLVEFVERDKEEIYVEIVEGTNFSNGDPIGMPKKGKSKLSVGSQGLLQVLPHELGHIMGLAHENDRNQVLKENAPAFDPKIGPRLYVLSATFGADRLAEIVKKAKNMESFGDYDILSIMHYPAMPNLFAWDDEKAAQEWLEALDGPNRPSLDDVKNNLWLPSPGDLATLRDLYKQ